MKRITGVILLAALVLGALYLWLVLPLNWKTISSKKAPEGRWVAYHLQSMSEAGDAPYGDHIVLAPSFWPLGQYYGEVVFAGYCPGGPEFRWLDEYHLKVTYQAGNVVKRTDTFGDIRIQYEIVEETPYQQAAQLTQ